MGTAVVALLTGMSTLLVNSAQNRQATTAAVVVRDEAEAVELAVAQPGAWCASSYTVVYTPPVGDSVTSAFGPCPANNSTTPQFQVVTVTATAFDGNAETLVIAVRKP